jgi:hypothetical protein
MLRKCARFQQEFLAILKQFERIVVPPQRRDEACVQVAQTRDFRDELPRRRADEVEDLRSTCKARRFFYARRLRVRTSGG